MNIIGTTHLHTCNGIQRLGLE